MVTLRDYLFKDLRERKAFRLTLDYLQSDRLNWLTALVSALY